MTGSSARSRNGRSATVNDSSEERVARLTPKQRAWIEKLVAEAPPVSPEVRAAITRILSNPGGAQPMRKHEFVRHDNTDGGHRDRVCEACGLSDTNPVHHNAKGEGL